MKKVIIIGATSGIGRGLAETYINEGCIVGIVGRRELMLQEICSQSEDCHYRVCDIPMTMIHFINSIHSLMKWEVWIFW